MQIRSGNLYREKRQKKNIKTLTALNNTVSTLDFNFLTVKALKLTKRLEFSHKINATLASDTLPWPVWCVPNAAEHLPLLATFFPLKC